MNDYNDDSDEYSSANSFRARSNTWPLNRPELTVPNAGICIDEPLPEIELEEEDLFTTNDNWTTGLEDHDIMSWDPILNAQSQLQQQQQQQASVASANAANNAANQQQQPPSSHQQQATIIHHHHQPTNHLQQAQNSQQSAHGQQPDQAYHQRQQSVHLQHLQPQQAPPKHHQQIHSHIHSPHEPILGCNVSASSIVTGSAAANRTVHQPHHHHHHHPHHHHQTLNNLQCLDPDDPNEYHIQQLHHLRLDSNPQPSGEPQQSHYVASISSVCIQGSNSIGNDGYNTGDHHQQNHHHNNHHHHHHNHHQHHLQPLTSARYDLDQANDYDSKAHDVDLQNSSNHLNRHNNLHLQHHHLNHHQSHQHQLQHLTSTVLDGHSGSSHPLLSSSLSTSGIGLNGDLEDLDYKSVNPSSILQSLTYDDLQQPQQQSQDPQQSGLQVSPIDDETAGNIETKQSNSNSTSKTKLNTPRRNAWGNMSYADLISQAINSTSDKRLTLSQIYDWMVQHVPYFKDKGDSNSSAGWKNSVRHNLSLHSRFKRLQNEGTGKSSWWTINPEANVGKCARRRAASMEASKYEKKRGRAKKRAEAVRQGLVSYPSLTNSSLNGSTTTLDQQQSQAQSINQFHSQPTEQIQPAQSQQHKTQRQQHNVQAVDQFAGQPQSSQKQIQQQAQTQQQQQTIDHYGVPDGPSHQQQQHLQHLQQMDGQNNLHDQGIYGVASQEPQYEEKNDKISQQQQHQQSSQYYYHIELSTAL